MAESIQRKFFKGQRVLTDDSCAASGGRPSILGVIYAEYLGPNSKKKEPAYLLIMLEDDVQQGLNWYFESELTLWCSDASKGQAIIEEYEKANG